MAGEWRNGSLFQRAAHYLAEFRSILQDCGEDSADIAELVAIEFSLLELVAERERIDARIRGHIPEPRRPP